MKKTLIISSYDDLKNPYFAGGGAKAVHEVAKRLTEGYSVTVITGRYPNSKNEIIDKVNYERIGTSFLGAQLDQLTFQVCLPFFVLTKKFDLWMESFTPPFSTNFLQLFTRKPVIGLVHMLSGEDMERKYKLPFHLIENLGLKTYKHIIVTSEEVRKKIYKQNPKAVITIIPNGIEKIHKIENTSGKKHILFLGRIEVNQKGLDLLLHAYAKIVKKTDYPLYIAGSGEKKEEIKLQNLITELRLENKVKLLGKVGNGFKPFLNEKEKAYQNALFVVVPSRFETFSVVALEAMSYGKPVVHFDISGLQWIPQNAGISVKSFNETKLAESMLRLIKDKKLTEDMGKNGQTYAKQFTWEKIAEKYKQLINTVLK